MFGVEERRTPPSSIFDLRIRRTTNSHLQSSIFGLEDRSEYRTEDGEGLLRRCGEFFEDWGFFDLPVPKRRAPHFRSSEPEERGTPPFSFSSDSPLPTNIHQAFSIPLRFQSSAQSSTFKIGPEIEISPLRARPSPPLSAAPPCAAPPCAAPPGSARGTYVRGLDSTGRTMQASFLIFSMKK